jgi:fumarate reductase flavoprotein subunit
MCSEKIQNNDKFTADVLVVGSGAAGLAAAAAAAEKNATVIILEKRNIPGGRSTQAEGFFAAESPIQEQMGIDASRDVIFKMAMDYAHWKINPRIFRAYVDKSGDTVRWIMGKGVQIDSVSPFYRNQKIWTWHQPKKGGAEVINALVKSCESMGVNLIKQTYAKRLNMGSDGKSITVQASGAEGEITIKAMTVILATGGYGGNSEMLKKYCSFYIDQMGASRSTFNTGDGLTMATEIGAATEGLGHLHIMGPVFDGTNAHISAVCQEPVTLWINKKGERFTDESTAFIHYESVNSILQQPDRISYSLIDEGIKQKMIENGPIKLRLGVYHSLSKTGFADLEKDFQSVSQTDRIKISDSWDNIAEWIGAPLPALKREIEKYNQYCDQKYDPVFNKDSRYLMALRKPPFYAIKCRTAIAGSIGGIKINHLMEVVDQNDNPIPGLYAAGTDAGGWESDTYNAHLSGTAFGFPLNSGRIAGENAAEYATNRKG